MKLKKKKVEELNRLSLQEYKRVPKLPIRLLLHNIRSLHNVGSIFRTADAFLVEKIYLSGYTGCPPNPEIRKTALGAEEAVLWEKIKEPIELINKLKHQGFTIASVEQTHNSTFLKDFKWNKKPLLLIFGNEVKGVDDNIIEVSDLAIEIEQFGTKHSLNVSVSAGIVLYHVSSIMFSQGLPVYDSIYFI